MRKFDIPEIYRSPIISNIKAARKSIDKFKKDFTPTTMDFGPLRIHVARHFGFCFGVENAIEIIYRIINENPGRQIYLLSEMIHNPKVNEDLRNMGIRFIQDTGGHQYIPWEEVTKEDIVVIPAFGTTLEIRKMLEEKGIEVSEYDTTCPFVEKVWKRSAQLGKKGYSVVIHGKPNHEETRATFSHSRSGAPSIVIKDMKEAKRLAVYIRNEASKEAFYEEFKGRYSENFDPENDLRQLGVVNQTTMLASDTQEIADYLKGEIAKQETKGNFADTRDTLCYATNDNQGAVYGMLKQPADLALVIGGYNSSNTSHLVELCEEKVPTYYISSADKLLSASQISYFDYRSGEEKITDGYIPEKEKVDILITSGASCPDAVVDEVIQRLLSLNKNTRSIDVVLEEVANTYQTGKEV